MKKSLHIILRLLFWITLSLTIASCKNGNNNPSKDDSQTIPTLNKTTIGRFSLQFEKDYDDALNNLIKQFKIDQKNDDVYNFIDYRNIKWTPAYINKKTFYTAVFNKNKGYLEKSPIAPLFNQYEYLIYIGINLKHGLLDNDKTLIEQTLAEAKSNQELVHSIVASTK